MEMKRFQREPLRLADNIALPRGRVHEVIGSARDSFAVMSASVSEGRVFWIGQSKSVYTLAPHGLSEFIDPTRLILIETANRKETLWAAEQALRCSGAGLVVVQLSLGPDLTESRRLQLSAETGGTLGLILIDKRAQSSASQTRWQCENQKSASLASAKKTNAARWHWELIKNKSGITGAWQVEWQDSSNGKKGHVHMAPATAA